MKNADSGKARRSKTGTASLQDTFLQELIDKGTRVSIFLVNGVKIDGQIKSFDRYVILMRNAVSDKVYKHAISTIVPAASDAAPAARTTIVEKKAPSKLSGRRLKP